MQQHPQIARRLLLGLADVVVGAAVLIAEVVRPLYAPLYRALSRLALVHRAEAWIARQAPYVVLGLLAVPFIGVEPLKLLGVIWMAQGRVWSGLALLAAAYLGSFVLVERIYEAGKEKLLTIGWLARIIGFVTHIRTLLLDRLRALPAWQAARAAAARVRGWFARRA